MIEVHYLDVDQEMDKNLMFSGENVQNSSDLTALPQLENNLLFATSELFGWPLDGKRRLVSETEKTAVWSTAFSGLQSGCLGAGSLGGFTLSSRHAGVETPPCMEVILPKIHTVPGITFVFAPREEQWCAKLELNLYRGQETVLSQMVYPDSPRCFIPLQGQRFDRLTVRLLETDAPGRYAKLSRLYLGYMQVFSHGDLEAVRLVNEADPTLDALTVDAMTVELRDPLQRGLTPRQGQQMVLFRDGQLLADHRIESCTRRDTHRYIFQCRSLVGQLEDTFLGGMYENVLLEDLLAQILQGIEFQVDESLKSATVTGYLPVCTRRQALQQAAFAVGALVSTWGSRGIRLCAPQRQITGSFRAETQFLDGEVEIVPGVSRLEAVAHRYAPSQEEVILMDEEYLQGSDILLTFQEPYHSYRVTGGTLLEQGVNHIRLSAAGEVTVKACPYIHTTVRYSRRYNPTEGVNRDQVRKVEQATLIHSRNVQALLDRLEKIYTLQQTLTQTVVVDGQFVGQQVALKDPFGGIVQGYITAMENELTPGGQTARITVLGEQFSPQIAVGYAGMLYAGEKEVCL